MHIDYTLESPMQPFIIFGTYPHTTIVSKGKFYCPHCSVEKGDQRQYERKKVRNYFSLYFVPMVPLGAGQEFVVCQFCGNVWQPNVLDMTFKPKRRIIPLADQLNTLETRLRDGTPIEYAVADLTAAGLDRDVAQQNVQQVMGDGRKHCPDCGLTYADNVEHCAEDDTPLAQRG
jgi:hypothetical protein